MAKPTRADDPRETLTELRLAMSRDFNLSFNRDGEPQEDLGPLLARAARVIDQLLLLKRED
jgi:hypothetical protein